MPNHIQNRLTFTGDAEQVKAILNSIKSIDKEGEAMSIDFNKIVPRPESLSIEPHSVIETWAKICTGQVDIVQLFQKMPDTPTNLFRDRQYGSLASRMEAATAMEYLMGEKDRNIKSFTEEEFDLFVKCLTNMRNHGHLSWYTWGIENWGTKWNAYGQPDNRDTENQIYFQTAWSTPFPVIKKLSEMHPNVNIQLDYADEDSGCNTGTVCFENGSPVSVMQYESQSKEAYDMYFVLHPDQKENYRLVGDKYEYVEENED